MNRSNICHFGVGGIFKFLAWFQWIHMLYLFIYFWEKVNFKSQILVHEYWTILDHFGVPVLFASGCHQQVLKDVNITFPNNTGTHKVFQYLPILGRSSIWDLKFTFSYFCFDRAAEMLLSYMDLTFLYNIYNSIHSQYKCTSWWPHKWDFRKFREISETI